MRRIKRHMRLEQALLWTPFERAYITREEVVRSHPPGTDIDAEMRRLEGYEVWKNNRYQVMIRYDVASVNDTKSIAWLSLKRLDRRPVHDWRDLQRCKNELIGPECEAVELYPAESRRVDSSNQYHLYCVMDPTFRFPFGYRDRLVTDNPGGKARQRPGATADDGRDL